jgi:AcrR family transcriptional regulator
MAGELGLRERKKLDTRRALSDAALQLAFEKGLENVTREDIANRSGVSLRTFSNYFTGKYDAITYRQVERFRRSLAALRERPPGEPIWQSITEAVLQPLENDGAGLPPPTRAQLAEIRKLVMAPESHMAVTKGISADWVAAIAERTGTHPDRDMYPQLVVGVLAAVANAATEAYVRADPPLLITTVFRRAFAAVAAGLPAPGGASE